MEKKQIARKVNKWVMLVIFLLLLIAEFFWFRLFNQLSSGGAFSLCASLLWVVVPIVLFVLAVIYGVRKGYLRSPDFQLISNIVRGVSRSHWVAIAILLLFLINLALLSNSLCDLFSMKGYRAAFWWSLIKCLAPVLATWGSLYLYPQAMQTKLANERSLLVCGLSKNRDRRVAPMNIDLLCKPFLENYAIKKMVIIPSRGEICFGKAQTGDDRFFPGTDALSQYNRIIDEFEAAKDEQIIGETIKKLMQVQIGEVVEFEVIVEKHVDYDNYEELLTSINNVLENYESQKIIGRETNNTLLYINPGTGVIGSMLAVFSIPGERLVLYFTQAQDENRLVDFGLRTKGMNSIIQEYEQST